MTTAIIIALCALLLLAYVYDITAPHTRIPSVVLLLASGWLVNRASGYFEVAIPRLDPLLPVLGSVGIILIVLEGSLELELNAGKTKLVAQSIVSAVLPIGLFAFGLAWPLQHFTGYPLRVCLINVVPLSVISSSVAISAVRSIGTHNREFVIYESSLSDICGVLFFNFLVLNETLTPASVSTFGIQLLLVLLVSFVATIGLSFLLSRINHHIKFAPIILLVILIYEISKEYHLPALIFILFFGLFLGNLEEFKRVRWIQRLNPMLLAAEVAKFKDIVTEATFLIRALFFLLFGFLIHNEDILDAQAFTWTLVVVAAIYVCRAVVLKLVGAPLRPLLFIAPRGLITILLYFAIDSAHRIPLGSKSLVLQVILLTSLVMMGGMTKVKKPALSMPASPELPPADVEGVGSGSQNQS